MTCTSSDPLLTDPFMTPFVSFVVFRGVEVTSGAPVVVSVDLSVCVSPPVSERDSVLFLGP